LAFPPELAVMITAALPVSELRGAIPLAVWGYGMPWWKAYLLGVLGNLAPLPVLLWGLDAAFRLLARLPGGRRIAYWLLARAERRSGRVERYGPLALITFVAIPLPVTGLWTGTLVAYVLGFRYSEAAGPLILGVLFAGGIVLGFTLLGGIGGILAGSMLLLYSIGNRLFRAEQSGR
jgi:Predicted membrane protein